MNVIVTIEGREAVPVRAIPLLTDWIKIFPDVVALIFAGDDNLFLHHPAFESLHAYQLRSDGTYAPTERRSWASWEVRSLHACSERIEATQTNREVGYQQWRQESLPLLPAGVFVWRDEYEAAYQSEYGPDSLLAFCNRDSYDADVYALNFNPEPRGLGGDWRTLVMQGFESVTNPAEHHRAQLAFVRGFVQARAGKKFDEQHWLALETITQKDAAILLLGGDPEQEDGGGIDSDRLAKLEQRLTAYDTVHPKHRSWREWHAVAKGIGADYERGFDYFFADAEQTSAQAAASEPVVAETAGVTWAIAKPQRYSGYSAPLYSLLAAAHREGRQRPTARGVLDAWRCSKPAEIAKVLTDSADYYDANGNTKAAGLDAIRKAIGRMTTSGR